MESASFKLISSAYRSCKEKVHNFADKVETVRLDPSGLQKLALCILSTLQTINGYFGKNYLPHLVTHLNIANHLDFFGCLKIPYYWFYPYSLERIDTLATLQNLKGHLQSCLSCQGVEIGTIHLFAQQLLEDYFDLMAGNREDCRGDLAFPDEAHFKEGLMNSLKRKVEDEKLGWDLSHISLHAFDPVLKPFSLLNKVTDFIFVSVDAACGAFFLQEWQLIDLAPLVKKIGSFRIFGWIKNLVLDTWIKVGLCIGFALQIIQAVRSLLSSKEGLVAIQKAWWQVAVATSEFVFNFASLVCVNQTIVYFLAAIAKGIGVIAIVCEPSQEYFPGRNA